MRVAVVANPTKSGDPYWDRRVLGVLERAGLPGATWIPTTAADPGPGQARQALADGAELVVVCGGDGTVRSVATVLAGTGVPMALLPSGTGNLLARNLEVPLEVEAAARVAASGRTAAIDVGRTDDGECFLVMAGSGFDAAMLRDTSDRAKVWLSWAAYVLAGMRHLRGPLATYDLVLDGVPVRRHGRGVLIGNVSALQAGLELLPGALADDGLLDVAVLAPRSLREWFRLARRVGIGLAPGEQVLERWTATRVTVRAEPAQPVQYDGDLVESGVVLSCVVEPGALLVRVPV
ncbi:MAG: diacylglycerol kinase catalytic region [Frankiales bacterium]|nr:diacylglycerol kinase catalytic region [Frankiales bacterium]